MICKNCNSKFHYCTSCDHERCCDLGFCSDKCLKESKFYKDALDLSEQFIDSLTDKQKIDLSFILENIYGKFETEFDNILADRILL